jgi:hypothetical protein
MRAHLEGKISNASSSRRLWNVEELSKCSLLYNHLQISIASTLCIPHLAPTTETLATRACMQERSCPLSSARVASRPQHLCSSVRTTSAADVPSTAQASHTYTYTYGCTCAGAVSLTQHTSLSNITCKHAFAKIQRRSYERIRIQENLSVKPACAACWSWTMAAALRLFLSKLPRTRMCEQMS